MCPTGSSQLGSSRSCRGAQSCPAVEPAGKAVSLLIGAAPLPWEWCTIQLKINNTGKSEDAEKNCNFPFDFSSSETLLGNPQLRHKQRLRDSKVPFIPLLQADLSTTQTDPSTSSSSSSLSFFGNVYYSRGLRHCGRGEVFWQHAQWPGPSETQKWLKHQVECKKPCVRKYSLWLQKNINQQGVEANTGRSQ